MNSHLEPGIGGTEIVVEYLGLLADGDEGVGLSPGRGLSLLALFVALRPVHIRSFVPHQNMFNRAKELNEFVAGLEGGVLSPYAPFLAVRNGHRNEQWHIASHGDMDNAGLKYDINRNIAKVGARWAILTKSKEARVCTLRKHYDLATEIPRSARVNTAVGKPVVLSELWRRKDE